jgi:hypothetical protein
MYDGAGEEPSSPAASRDVSGVRLLGVQAASSAGKKEPWLSDDA